MMMRLARALQYTWPNFNHKCISDPEVYGEGWLTFETWVRKEHEGKYYLIPVSRKYYFGISDLTPAIPNFLQRFCVDVYLAQMLFKLPFDHKDQFGEEIVLEDPNTVSEIERVKKIYMPYKHE